MHDVDGKVAFITGGASGIGLGIAKAFTKAGMKVVLADVRQDHLNEAIAYFEESGQRESVHGIQLDVTDRGAFMRAADETEKVFKKVHMLCNNAGIAVVGPLKQSTYDDWDWGLSVMVGGVINGIQTFLPRILKHGEGGHILTTSSTTGLLPTSGVSIYATAKAAVIGLSESIRGELAADNIGVSAFCPGPVQTNIREVGRIRPSKYQNSGFKESERALEGQSNSPNWMTIEECGERILRGILRNDLYILTHREFKEGVAERFSAILSAFPDEAINTVRADEIRFLTSNPIFSEANTAR